MLVWPALSQTKLAVFLIGKYNSNTLLIVHHQTQDLDIAISSTAKTKTGFPSQPQPHPPETREKKKKRGKILAMRGIEPRSRRCWDSEPQRRMLPLHHITFNGGHESGWPDSGSWSVGHYPPICYFRTTHLIRWNLNAPSRTTKILKSLTTKQIKSQVKQTANRFFFFHV